MKSLVRSILITSTLLVGTNGLMAQSGPTFFDQWYKAKYGRNSPAEEARLKAEQASSAYREEKASARPARPKSYMDQFFKAKLGVYTPAEEARLRAERESSAYRAEPQPQVAPESYIDQWLRVKQGITRKK